jgi:D-glycero-D-manno-heptose 1,7-bisphosphate phosphatase
MSPVRSLRRAAFVDRDGVINVDSGYVHRWSDFRFLDGAVDGLRALQSLGYRLVVVSNQSGVARGLFARQDVDALHRQMIRYLEDQGIAVSGVYYCPHHPEGTVPEFAVACDCRKPRPGMILRAVAELGIDPGQSLLIGDKWTDVEAARRAGLGAAYLIAPAPAANGAPAIDGVFPDLRRCAAHLADRERVSD